MDDFMCDLTCEEVFHDPYPDMWEAQEIADIINPDDWADWVNWLNCLKNLKK